MDWTSYLTIFSLSFAVSAFTPRSSPITTHTGWTTGWTVRPPLVPTLPSFPPALLALSGPVLILASLFSLVHITFSLFCDARLTAALRLGGIRAVKAVLYERAFCVLRGMSRGPSRSTRAHYFLEIPSARGMLIFWVGCAVYYMLVTAAQAGVSRWVGKARRTAMKAPLDKPEPTSSTPPHLTHCIKSALSAITPTLYNLSVFGHFSLEHSQAGPPHTYSSHMNTARNRDTGRGARFQVLYTTLVDISALDSVDLTLHIDGVEHSLPTVDLHTLVNKVKERSRNPVHIRLPVPVGFPTPAAVRVVLFVVLAPAREDEDEKDDGDREGVGEEANAQDRTLVSRVSQKDLSARREARHYTSTRTLALSSDSTFSPARITTGAFEVCDDHLSAETTPAMTYARGHANRVLTSGSGQSFLDVLKYLPQTPSSCCPSSSSTSCLSTPSPSRSSLRPPMDLNAPVFVPRAMRFAVGRDNPSTRIR
ncbi:hypothetical protein C8T65DRAFT_742858 [Cerioporus squamosus]|nr:hypothetical protein C8T65DRAFT_742858 [Cerioporus squamosus]